MSFALKLRFTLWRATLQTVGRMRARAERREQRGEDEQRCPHRPQGHERFARSSTVSANTSGRA
jgi:hypothetical protein